MNGDEVRTISGPQRSPLSTIVLSLYVKKSPFQRPDQRLSDSLCHIDLNMKWPLESSAMMVWLLKESCDNRLSWNKYMHFYWPNHALSQAISGFPVKLGTILSDCQTLTLQFINCSLVVSRWSGIRFSVLFLLLDWQNRNVQIISEEWFDLRDFFCWDRPSPLNRDTIVHKKNPWLVEALKVDISLMFCFVVTILVLIVLHMRCLNLHHSFLPFRNGYVLFNFFTVCAGI